MKLIAQSLLRSEASTSGTANRVLLGLFLLHYTQRTFIFPLLIRGGKPTPAVLVLMAFAFCLYNGYIQACQVVYSPSQKANRTGGMNRAVISLGTQSTARIGSTILASSPVFLSSSSACSSTSKQILSFATCGSLVCFRLSVASQRT